jgi:hypothetical protein
MNKKTPAALALLLLLSACAGGPILMQNPKTGQVFECAQANQYAKLADEGCAKTLEAQGWTRIAPAESKQ